MSIFWRRTVKELAAQLDVIDELIHALVVALEVAEERERGCCEHREDQPQAGNEQNRFHLSGTPPRPPPLADLLLERPARRVAAGMRTPARSDGLAVNRSSEGVERLIPLTVAADR